MSEMRGKLSVESMEILNYLFKYSGNLSESQVRQMKTSKS